VGRVVSNVGTRKKLIEVALPLEAINRESAREKSIRHGHPSTLHLWWARRPLAACRAVLFASIVDDPSSRPDLFPTEEEQEVERQRLFRIIEELVKWENTTNETVLDAARAEIMNATDGNPPPVLDPFCGGGSIPLEAQRLGLEAHASDLNPVAVLITKALIEIPPKFAGQPPVNPESREKLAHGATWKGAQGLAEDVRYYGKWMRDRVFERIGHLYPKAKLPDGGEAAVLAWIWARSATCPNPACGLSVPLVRSFSLSTQKGREAFFEPSVGEGKRMEFRVLPGRPSSRGTITRTGAACITCETPLPFHYLREQGRSGSLGDDLVALVVQDGRSRSYISPDDSTVIEPSFELLEGTPATGLPDDGLGFRVQAYGLVEHAELYTRRQLALLIALTDAVADLRTVVVRGCESAGLPDAESYADGLSMLLALSASKAARFHTVLSYWRPDEGKLSRAYGRQTVSMTWDYAETNPFASSGGDIEGLVEGTAQVLGTVPATPPASVEQLDARHANEWGGSHLVSTDPPYYDNVGYADLSDIFYVWIRRALRDVRTNTTATLLTPKDAELIADPGRFSGDRSAADTAFESGMMEAFEAILSTESPRFPTTVYYAFRQAETTERDPHGRTIVASTGWETMLEGLMGAGFRISGTWPMRTEGPTRMRGQRSNALASSIVLVCRPRHADAAIATRRELVSALRDELPGALKQLQHGNIAPVDLAQAAIGPGMAVFSRYAKVLEADGMSMTVRSALALINQALDEILAEQEGDFDADTRFAVTWFEQHGFAEAPFGEADVLARAKDTSTGGLEDAGVVLSRAGKVRLLRRDELPEDWDPVADRRPTVWEAAHHLARRLETGGETAAGELLRRLGGLGEVARELAYRLYTTCERKGWAQDALAYNALVVAWPEIARLVAGTPEAEAQQALEL
jgi:putative DNA methylase